MPPASSSCSGFRESEAPSPPSAADLRGSANHEVCPRERPSRPAGAEEPKPALGAGPRGAQLAGAPRPCRPLLRGGQLARRLRRQLHSRVTARAWVGFVRGGHSVFLSATILHHVARVYPSPFVHARHLRGLLRDKWEVFCFLVKAGIPPANYHEIQHFRPETCNPPRRHPPEPRRWIVPVRFQRKNEKARSWPEGLRFAATSASPGGSLSTAVLICLSQALSPAPTPGDLCALCTEVAFSAGNFHRGTATPRDFCRGRPSRARAGPASGLDPAARSRHRAEPGLLSHGRQEPDPPDPRPLCGQCPGTTYSALL